MSNTPPPLNAFGLIGVEEALRLDDQRYWSLPKCIFERIPTIQLDDQFTNTSACGFIVDGVFSLQELEKFAIKNGRNDDINGIGDPEIMTLCRAAISSVIGDFRGYNCKKLVGLLYKYSGSENSSLGYLPALGLLPLFHLNSLSKNDVIAVIEDVRFPVEQLISVATALDDMAGLIAILISRHADLFLPNVDTSYMHSVQHKSWIYSLSTFVRQYPNCAVSSGAGVRKLRVAVAALVLAINEINANKRKKKWINPEDSQPADVESEPSPEDVEICDEEDDSPVVSTISLISVVDTEKLKGDSGLRRVTKESWSISSLDRLLAGVTAKPLESAIFEQLALDYPHASKLLLHIAQTVKISESYGQPVYTLPRPVLLLGASGVGKTHLCRAIAEACGLANQVISLAGASDSKIVTGSHRSWQSAMPSAPVQLLADSGQYNGCLVVDEIDKANASHNGDPVAALLGMVERSSAKRFYDQFLCANVDISGVNWLLTSNSAKLSPALLSRCDVFHLRAPSADQFPALVAKIRKTFGEDIGVDARFLPVITVEDIEFLQSHCVGDIRALAAATRRMLQHRSAEAHPGAWH